MNVHNEIVIRASPKRCLQVAADVERWPQILSHYRWVRFLRKDGFATGLVEMAARRPFGPVAYPVWWASEMRVQADGPAILFRHVRGITKGMDVEWRFRAQGDGQTRVEIRHDWPRGPRWPLVGRLAAGWVIGPVFIHAIADRTLRGIKRAVESSR